MEKVPGKETKRPTRGRNFLCVGLGCVGSLCYCRYMSIDQPRKSVDIIGDVFADGIPISYLQPFTAGCTCGGFFRLATTILEPGDPAGKKSMFSACTPECHERNDDFHRWPLPEELVGKVSHHHWIDYAKRAWYNFKF